MPILSSNIKVIFSCSHMKKDTFKMLPNKNKWCHKLCFFFVYLKAKGPCTDFFLILKAYSEKHLNTKNAQNLFIYNSSLVSINKPTNILMEDCQDIPE